MRMAVAEFKDPVVVFYGGRVRSLLLWAAVDGRASVVVGSRQ